MLTFKDSTGTAKFVLKDDDTKPVEIDQIVIRDLKKEEEKESDDASQPQNGK